MTRSLASSPSNPAAGAAFPGTTKRVAPNSRAGFRVSGCGMATGLITVCRVLSDVAPWRCRISPASAERLPVEAFRRHASQRSGLRIRTTRPDRGGQDTVVSCSRSRVTRALLAVCDPFGRHGPEQNSTTIRVVQSSKSTTIGSMGCDRYYSETIENNNFVTILMDVSAPLIELIKYSSTDISKHSAAVLLDVIQGEQ